MAMADRSTSIPGNQIKDDSVTQSELDLTNTPTDGQIIKINMPAGDMTAIDFIPADLNIAGQTAEDYLVFDGSGWEAHGGDEIRRATQVAYDVSTASGTLAITGAGFKPSAVLILANISGTSATSIGFSQGSTDLSIQNAHSKTANTWENDLGDCILLQTGASDFVTGDVSSFDSDGITLNFTKSGSPTGTSRILVMFFR